eukprot:5351844-Pyramimonas_sp.AAC.1
MPSGMPLLPLLRLSGYVCPSFPLRRLTSIVGGKSRSSLASDMFVDLGPFVFPSFLCSLFGGS